VADAPSGRLMAPDGKSGWYAFSPEGSVPPEHEPWAPPAEGSILRFMGEHTVEVPLWDDEGLLFNDRQEFESQFGVSEGLASDIVAWAAAWDAGDRGAELDREAASVVRRLITSWSTASSSSTSPSRRDRTSDEGVSTARTGRRTEHLRGDGAVGGCPAGVAAARPRSMGQPR
jgi:hypothetical protein